MKATTLSLVLALGAAPAAAGTVHHQLVVVLAPAAHTLEVEDNLTLGPPDADGEYRFTLHAGLAPEVASPRWKLEPVPGESATDVDGLNATSDSAGAVPLETWRLVPAGPPAFPVALRYHGVIHHPIVASGEEYQRSFAETPGIVDAEGVFLSGTSTWVPTFGEELVTFELAVRDLPPGWDAVSQGERQEGEGGSVVWRCPDPSEEVYLVAAAWHRVEERAGKVALYAFLRSDDPALASRYLQATRRYLTMYQQMLGDYPYPSFALVESFWETGYGMPGFTLLGPKIIRFPWILTSSYPHELVHSWWGNSVYVDYGSGNWCEGLTAYLADHLFAEQRGEGALYRRATLQKYTDFVTASRDLPLVDFRSRRSPATEAVGYGKSMMLFHMLRRAMGDEQFLKSLRRFAEEQRFHRASWSDLARAFGETAGGDWERFITAWTSRAGAPRLEIVEATATPDASPTNPWRLNVVLRQAQAGEPFPMSVPVAVTLEGVAEPVMAEVGSCEARCSLSIPCAARPLRVDVDPAFDVMRRLDPLEVPPALSTLFGADDPLFVLPAEAPADELVAWRDLATGWAMPKQPRLELDSNLPAIPAGPVWLLGRHNRLRTELLERLAASGVASEPAATVVAGESVPAAGHSLVLVARSAADPAVAVGWVSADPPAAIAGLARKLPHYTKYSYLAFRGEEPENNLKGMWSPVGSPLSRNLGPGELPGLKLRPRRPLAELPAAFDGDAMARDVTTLAAPDMEGRGLGSAGLERATAWVERQLREAGLEPAGEGGYRQRWSVTAGEPPREMELANLLARVPGTDPALAAHPVVLMAHLDHLGLGWPDVREGNQGKVHPGADDNASGVAVLLALGRALATEPARPRPVLLAITTGEEAKLLGSRHLLGSLSADSLPFACVNLDTVGRLSSGKLYVLSSDSAREWRHIFLGVGYTTGAPVTLTAEPLDSSDQVACLERSVPAVQLFTGPHTDYHRPTDTAEKIDAAGLATVAEAVHEAVAYLAERSEPLTVTIASQGAAAPPAPADPRRASLGTVPDFGFGGPGVRVQEVMPGSAAEKAGIAAGDVLVALDGEPIADLRGYSQLLAARKPGDSVTVRLLRNGQDVSVTATLGAR